MQRAWIAVRLPSGGAGGMAACMGVLQDCDGDAANGCEADVSIDGKNCGTCDHDCQGGACVNGLCPTITVLSPGQPFAYAQDIAVDQDHVYWTELIGGGVKKVPIAGGATVTLASDQVEPAGIAVDATTVYWANYGNQMASTINKIPLAGGAATLLASDVVASSPQCVAVDGQSVYWANANNGDAVRKVPLAGGPAVTIVPPLDVPQCLAIDATHVYWTSMSSSQSAGGGTVRSAPLGGGAPTLLVGGLFLPFRISRFEQLLAWTDVGDHTVRVADTSGGGMITVASDQEYPWGVAVDERYVYWASHYGGEIRRALKDGTGSVTVLATGQQGPTAIALGTSRVFWVNQDTGAVLSVAR